ncbi:hypothetical protein [Novosphingobium sp. ZW T3_23]|uniref:hypothetical protein n=1 Tax=Novosphingobium sp. ZW T3_23 TaxID=3378084 RepID=UPI0038539326
MSLEIESGQFNSESDYSSHALAAMPHAHLVLEDIDCSRINIPGSKTFIPNGLRWSTRQTKG